MGSPLASKDPDKSFGIEKQNLPKYWAKASGHQRRRGGLICPANGGNFKAGIPKASFLIEGDQGSPRLVNCFLTSRDMWNNRWKDWLIDWKALHVVEGIHVEMAQRSRKCSADGPDEPSGQSKS